MSRKVLRFDEKTKGFVEVEKPAPELLPEQLRGLPSSFVTKDSSDPDKVHALDDPHIVDALTYEQGKKEQASEKPKADSILNGIDLTHGPFTQLHIDLIRFKVIKNMVDANLQVIERGDHPPFDLKKTRHLWFPKEKLDPRELRNGRPPLKSDQPYHLKDKDLIVDAYNWPERIIDMLRAKGLEVPNIAAMEAQMMISAPRLVY